MSKIKVKIIADDVKGSESGQDLDYYDKGKVYNLDSGLANVLLKDGLAEPVKEKTQAETKSKAKAEPEAKESKPEIENKAIDAAPENKKKPGKKK